MSEINEDSNLSAIMLSSLMFGLAWLEFRIHPATSLASVLLHGTFLLNDSSAEPINRIRCLIVELSNRPGLIR